SPFDLAALGMTDELLAALLTDTDSAAGLDELNDALWSACHGGHLDTARTLVARGANVDWLPGWEHATPLDIAARAGAYDVISWLHSLGAHTCDQLRDT
ncbi:MAG: ankyrin repeat domain-containing protein, partial [Nocardioides sp.]